MNYKGQLYARVGGKYFPIGDADAVITEAIAEHERNAWHYDKNYPEHGEIFVETEYGFFIGDVNRSNLDVVIRWRELPSPYQETPPAKFNDTTSRPYQEGNDETNG